MKEENRNREKENPRLRFHPLKDGIVLLSACGVLGVVLGLSFGLKPKSEETYVTIQYQETLLWQEEDSTKNVYFSFPDVGEKKILFSRTSGKEFIGTDFEFVGESVGITLYCDKSVRILHDDITCPDHTCTRFGRVYDTYQPIVCLPNRIQVQIVTKEKPKAGEWDA